MSSPADTNETTVPPTRYELDPSFPNVPDSNPLGEVAGVAVDQQDRVYLVNRSAMPVQIYTSTGDFVTAWKYNDFIRVHGVTIGPDGRVYIADDRRHVIRVFDSEGSLVQTLGTPDSPSDTGVEGTNVRTVKRAGPPFNLPTNTAIGSDGTLFVSDGYGNSRVHHFTHDGELIHSWGTPGSGPGEFTLPHDVTVDANGRVLVADRENGRIQVFSPDGTYETEYGGLFRPCGMWIDSNGTIYVAELGPRHGRVTILDSEGNLEARWTLPTPIPSAGGHSIAVDSEGSIYVGLVFQGNPPPEGASPIIKYRRK